MERVGEIVACRDGIRGLVERDIERARRVHCDGATHACLIIGARAQDGRMEIDEGAVRRARRQLGRVGDRDALSRVQRAQAP